MHPTRCCVRFTSSGYHDGCCTTPFNHSKPGCQTGCEKICADWGALPCSDNQCAPVYMGEDLDSPFTRNPCP